MIMIVGLGNPGKRYAQTRHNIGFLVVNSLLKKFSFLFEKSQFNTKYSKGLINNVKVIIVKPLSFMNKSGFPIQRISSYFKINLSNIIVIHDDIDLDFGRVLIAKNRGHGGHNGIKSIINSFGSKNFIRIKVGVGRPREQTNITNYVLDNFSKEENKKLKTIIEKSIYACTLIIKNGVEIAMNLCNTRKQNFQV